MKDGLSNQWRENQKTLVSASSDSTFWYSGVGMGLKLFWVGIRKGLYDRI
jgi:hypothetical protein